MIPSMKLTDSDRYPRNPFEIVFQGGRRLRPNGLRTQGHQHNDSERNSVVVPHIALQPLMREMRLRSLKGSRLAEPGRHLGVIDQTCLLEHGPAVLNDDE